MFTREMLPVLFTRQRFFKCSLALLMLLSSMVYLQAAAVAAPQTDANAKWNVNFNRDGSNPAAYYGKWDGHTYFPSPDDWRKVSVYQFITDRFSDGDPSNNEGKYGGYNLYRVDTRHGGDFLGVRDRLDYIKSLGYNAIWISPVFQNRNNSYHGYGQIDFTLIDDRFGTLDDFRAMVKAAHDRGMYVIVDIVVNHMENFFYFEGYPAAQAPFKMHQGEYRVLPRDPNQTYADFWVNNTFSPTGQYPDIYNWDGKKVTDTSLGSGSFWASDFHHNGDLGDYGNPWHNHLGKIYGLYDDLRTSHPRVQDKIIAMTQSLIASTDIDGIRMDTPMQVPLSFFKRWVPAVKSYAATLGKKNFFIFGEYYSERARGATMTGRGKEPQMWNNPTAFIDQTYTMDSGINYQLYFHFFQPAIKDQQNGKLGQLKTQYDLDWQAYDFYNPVAKEQRYTMLNFYNNHDQVRMANVQDGFQKTNLGSAIIAYWPGIPLFYYGDEQGFNSEGTALDGWSREDFMTSLAWYNVKATTGINPAIKDNFDMTNPSYQYVQKIMNVRRQYPALQATDEVIERWKQLNDSNGIYAFSRVWGTANNWALVVFNNWSGWLEAGGKTGTFTTGWNQGDQIVNALDPSERYTLGAGGKLDSLWVKPYETKVFVRADGLKALDPVVQSVSPAHDSRVTTDQQTVKITFSEPMDEASVKASFRFNGQSVPAQQLTYDATARTLTYNVTVPDGVHQVVIADSAKSLAGKSLYGQFSSRFRKGSDLNPIANPKLAWIRNDQLINNGAATTSTTSVKLNHQSPGAKLFRVSNDAGNTWSAWFPYQAQSDWKLAGGTVAQRVVVQYWTDGSAAYYVDDEISFGASAGIGNVSQFPANADLDPVDDLQVSIQSWPVGSASAGKVFYRMNGSAWNQAGLTKGAAANGFDPWQANLGKFPAGTTIQYYFELTTTDGRTLKDDLNGLFYTTTVNGSVPGNSATIYYKGTVGSTGYIHYKISGSSTWTTVPGVKMASSEFQGYNKVTIQMGSATSLEAAFNNGESLWDSNGGKNYVINAGTSTIDMGVLKSGTPLVDSESPTTPAGLTSTGQTASSVTLSWNAATDNIGVAGYDILYRGGTKIGSTASTSFTDSGLTANTMYTYTVRAYDAAGNRSPESQAVSVQTKAGSSATIYYKVPSGNTSYIHYKKENGTWTTAPGEKMTASTVPGFNVITIPLGAMTQVEAVFNNGSGSWDNNSGGKNYVFPAGTSTLNAGVIKAGEPEVSTDKEAPTVPANLVVTRQTSNAVSISWTASTDNTAVSEYEIIRDGAQVGRSATTSYTDGNLSANTSYSYAVRAVDAAGNKSADSTAVTAKTSVITGNSATVYYKNPWTTPATAYIHYRLEGSTAWTTVPGRQLTASEVSGYLKISIDLGNATGIAEAAFNNGASVWDSNAGKNYKIPSGTSTIANGVLTSGVPVAGGDATAPSTPANVTKTTVTANSIGLSWTAATDNIGVVRYDILRNGTKVGSSTSASYTDSGLTASTSYSYTVHAVDAAGNVSAGSNPVSITTSAGATANTVTIYYKVPSGTVSYIHYRPAAGAWTQAPGIKMSASEVSGFNKITLTIGTASSIEAVFNNGSGAWDNNSSKNYIFQTGTFTLTSGVIKSGSP